MMMRKIIVFLDRDRKEIFDEENLKATTMDKTLRIKKEDDIVAEFSHPMGWRYQEDCTKGILVPRADLEWLLAQIQMHNKTEAEDAINKWLMNG